MHSSLSLLMSSSNSEIRKSPLNSLSLSRLFFFSVFFFSQSSSYSLLLSLCYPLFSSLSSSSLSTMTVVFVGFVLVVVPSSSNDSNIGAKWLMLVLHPCLFPSKSSNCSMVALTSVASIFQDDCWGGFLGHLSLTRRWILDLWLDLSSRRLGGDLAMVVVSFVQLEVDSK